MNVPLNVVQDEEGRLRDVNGQPMIVVFPSKPKRPRATRKSGSAKDETRTEKNQSFAFINVTRPDEEDESSRQLIRTHVMKDFRARAREKRKPASGLRSPPPASNEQRAFSDNVGSAQDDASHAPALPAPTVGPDPAVFPVRMQPYMRRLIHQYSTSIYPHLDPKPCARPQTSVWFPMVMTDPALFHAILCTSAIYMDLISGREEETFTQRKHMTEAISLINTRLQRVDAKECVSDATITTILFIAKVEYAQRNYINWNIHMEGLTKIVKIRGGMTKLRNFVRQKIYNTELTGCIETGSTPRFLFIEDTIPIGSLDSIHTLSPRLQSLQQAYSLDPNLLCLLNEVESITNGIATLSDMDRELKAVHLRYRLLSDNSDSANNPHLAIHQCLRYGAILYTKTLVQSPSIRGIDYTTVLSSLRLHLSNFQSTCSFEAISLLLWLLFVGGITSENICRSWFIARSVDVTYQAGINTWESAKLHLDRFWWIESVHEEPFQHLWEDVTSMRVESGK